MKQMTKRQLADRIILHRSLTGFALNQSRLSIKPLKLIKIMPIALLRLAHV